MKKTLFLILLFVLASSTCVSSVTAKKSINEDITFQQREAFQDGFEDNRVLVVLSNEESKKLKNYTKNDFKEIDVDYIIDLTINLVELYREYEKGNYEMIEGQNDIRLRLDINSFHQVLAIFLSTHSKDNGLKTINLLKKRDEFVSVEPDYEYNNDKSVNCNDPFFDNDYLPDEYYGKWALDKISVPDMWEITRGNYSVKVGVLDYAIYSSHEDLIDNFSSQSRNFVHGYEEPFSVNIVGAHGTLVAGPICAKPDNYKGIAGVCWDVSLVSLNIRKDNNAYDNTTIVPAISYATSKNIQVLNMSLDLGDTNAFKAAVLNYPGLIVCAAGNYGSNTIGFGYPILWDLDNVISVGGSDMFDNKTDSSNWHENLVHVFAPGHNIQSTYPINICINNTCDPDIHFSNGYHLTGGTSIAAPFVAGVAAAVLSVNPKLSATEVKRIILDNVDDVPQLHGLCTSGGRLNAYKAVRAATESTTFINDVNGDGNDDMILIRKINGKYAFSVFNGQATGYFSNPTTTTTTRDFDYDLEPFCGDFNGDGKADILLHYAVNSYRHFSMFLGQSNGTFGQEISISSTRYHDELLYPYKAFVADHDGDHKDDFILLYENDYYKIGILIYKGKSTSSYLIDATSTYSSNIPYRHDEEKLIGYFNDDDMADIVVNSKDASGARVLYAFISQGNCNFISSSLSSIFPNNKVDNPYKLLIGDVNGGGKDDFIVQYKNSQGYRDALVYKGKDSSPYFTSPTTPALTSSDLYNDSYLIYAGDFTGDGRSDVLVEYGYNNYRQLLTYRGKTNGNFYSGINQNTSNGYNLKTWPANSYVGDINGDEIDDFIVKWKYVGDDEVSVHVYLGGYLENSDNIFSSAKTTHSYIPFYNE